MRGKEEVLSKLVKRRAHRQIGRQETREKQNYSSLRPDRVRGDLIAKWTGKESVDPADK